MAKQDGCSGTTEAVYSILGHTPHRTRDTGSQSWWEKGSRSQPARALTSGRPLPLCAPREHSARGLQPGQGVPEVWRRRGGPGSSTGAQAAGAEQELGTRSQPWHPAAVLTCSMSALPSLGPLAPARHSLWRWPAQDTAATALRLRAGTSLAVHQWGVPRACRRCGTLSPLLCSSAPSPCPAGCVPSQAGPSLSLSTPATRALGAAVPGGPQPSSEQLLGCPGHCEGGPLSSFCGSPPRGMGQVGSLPAG